MNSLIDESTSAALAFMAGPRSKSTRLAVKQPVARTLARLSLIFSSTTPVENISTGGFVATAWKKEYGARLATPSTLSVPIHPIGRGTTRPVVSL